MTPLIWTRRAIEDVQSIQQFIAQDSPHYAELVRQQLIAAVERLPTFLSQVELFQKSIILPFGK